MAQSKMKFGIDLGTTNSAICKMENGEPIVRKSETLKDTLPSCVSFTRKKIVKVGDSAYNDLRSDKARATKKWSKLDENVFLEFKRTMGLDTAYASKNMERSFSSEELSAEVLKTLKSFVSDDVVDSAVITIPAKFKADQIAATKRAAKLAGIEHCELLQEPIAASMAYGLSNKQQNGYWLVFDFGGGTFDAALLQVEDGIMQVIDTEGDNYLGGKDLDYAIVDSVIIPYLKENYVINDILADDVKRQILRDAVKFYAEQAKNQLSFKAKCDIQSQLDEFGDDDEGNPIDLEMVITQAQIEGAIRPVFQRAVDITINLLRRKQLEGKLDKLILVGGPTYSPVLRQMLKEQVTPNVDTSIDPMTAVARGAALFASTIDVEVDTSTRAEENSVALEVSYESTSVETLEFVSVKLLPKECKGSIPEKVFVEMVKSDNSWSSGKVEVNEIGDVIECPLVEGKANAFNFVAYDAQGNPIPCFPTDICIIQGSKPGSSTLPYHIGIEVRDTELEKDVFAPIKGLEKNQQLPAVGVRNGLKTPKQLRPGVSDDRLLIPIYQGEFNAEGSNAIHNDHVFDVEITGDDVPALVPADSDIDITIKVDRSQLMKMEVTFPVIGETIEKEIDVKARKGVELRELVQKLDDAKRKLRALDSASSVDASETKDAKELLDNIGSRFEEEKASEDGKMHLLADLRRAFLKMEEVEKKHEWETLEADLRHEFERLEDANNELGNKYDKEVAALRQSTDRAISSKDVKLARAVLKEIEQVFVGVTLIYQLVGFIKQHSQHFNSYSWKNPTRARELLDRGEQLISSGTGTQSDLLNICRGVIDVLDMPENEKVKFG